jgi:hypothetical protein
MSEPEFDTGLGGVLKCANCGDVYTHHETVEVFVRTGEDKGGSHITVREHGNEAKDSVGGPTLVCDEDMSRNPSDRRGGIKIVLWCEMCAERTAVVFSQHKGYTHCESFVVKEEC